jgi:hypothetical protein
MNPHSRWRIPVPTAPPDPDRTHHLLVTQGATAPLYRLACQLDAGWKTWKPEVAHVLEARAANCASCNRITAWVGPLNAWRLRQVTVGEPHVGARHAA